MTSISMQAPPSLTFPSRDRLALIACEIAKDITTLNVFQFLQWNPENLAGGSRRKRVGKACGPCNKGHLKCHGQPENAGEPVQNACQRNNCPCKYHDVSQEQQTPSTPTPSGNDTVPSTTGIHCPGLLDSRHFAGETSFCNYIPKKNQPKAFFRSNPPPVPSSFPVAPTLTQECEKHLIDVYYNNASPYFPLLDKSFLLAEHELCKNKQPSYLSPLFFAALFARAAHIAGSLPNENKQFFQKIGDGFMDHALFLKSYQHNHSSISSILALVIMANDLDQTKRYDVITDSWILGGDAFRMAVDLGIHRMGNLNEDDIEDQLCIRTFWLAYITDATISLSYGRPSCAEEKQLDVVIPKIHPTEEELNKHWVQSLIDIATFSKISVRIVRFNYAPEPKFKLEGPIKRHNAFLASIDSWLTDMRDPLIKKNTTSSRVPNIFQDRLDFQKEIFFLTNLILLHRPYIHDTVDSNARPSLDICSHAASAIIFYIYKLGDDGLVYHSNVPMLAYALVIALRIQIMNAAGPNSFRYNSSKLCLLGLNTLGKLPQSQVKESVLFDVLEDLKDLFQNGQSSSPSNSESESVYIAQRSPPQYQTLHENIFGSSSSQNNTTTTNQRPPLNTKKSKRQFLPFPIPRGDRPRRKNSKGNNKQSSSTNKDTSRRGSTSRQNTQVDHALVESQVPTQPNTDIPVYIPPVNVALQTQQAPALNEQELQTLLHTNMYYQNTNTFENISIPPIHTDLPIPIQADVPITTQPDLPSNILVDNITHSLHQTSMDQDTYMNDPTMSLPITSVPFLRAMGLLFNNWDEFLNSNHEDYVHNLQYMTFDQKDYENNP